MKTTTIRTVVVLIGLIVIRPAGSEGVPEAILWSHCPPVPVLPAKPVPNIKDTTSGTITAHADRARVLERGVSKFTGNVEVSQYDQAIRADVATYDRQKDFVRATGNVHYWDDTIYWAGERASSDRVKQLITGGEGRYRLLNRRGYGKARNFEVETESNITRMKDVDYTTCPGEVGAWALASKNMKLDHNTERGRALHVFLKVKDFPVLYFPYINFPISDKRKTGFLPPIFGASSSSGADISLPFYWNIAPNQDATFVPRVLSKRGAMLGGQYRYLNKSGGGEIDVELLPSDNERDGDQRASVGVRLGQGFAKGRARANVDLSWVSDDEYVEDLGTSLAITSQRFLQQEGNISYSGDRWSLFAGLQHFQNIDSSLQDDADPYSRLPQVRFNTQFPGGDRRLNFQFGAETNYFYRTDAVVGTRIELRPELSYPMRSPGTFFVPKVQLRHSQYFLDDTDSEDAQPDRTLPVASIDSGVILERNLQLGQSDYIHTLEPRLFYLYIPNSGQDDIPVFDAGEFDPSYFNLFRDNRFTGGDRIGDANQVALGLTTRLIKRDTGWEYARASIGSQFFFRDRDVTLNPGQIEDDSTSEIIAEVATRFRAGLSAIYDLQLDPHEGKIEKGTAQLRYQPGPYTVFNAAYRFRRDPLGQEEFDLDQTDVSARWPLTSQLSVIGRWNYSLKQSKTLEAVAGLEYNSCCWGIRGIFRRFLRDALDVDSEFDNAFLIQLELKGLAGVGGSTEGFLRESIPGYQNQF